MPLRPRRKVLSDNMHFYRARHWPMIQKIQETKGGLGVRKVKGIERVIAVFKKRQAEQRLLPKQVENSARAIEFLASLITDEAIKRADEQGLKHGSWDDEYENCIRHFISEMPQELRYELEKRRERSQ